MIKDAINSMNPVSIIAVFAALSEASAATALPFLHEDNQGIYVWFLIIFPSALIFMFFLTLNFNYKALYAPSDFSNEKNFLKIFEKSESSSKDSTHPEPLKAPANKIKKKSLSRLLLHPENRVDVIYGRPLFCRRDLKDVLSLLATEDCSVHSDVRPSIRWILVLKDWSEPVSRNELIALIKQRKKSTQYTDTFAVLTHDSNDIFYV
jgi:hypothetical protein